MKISIVREPKPFEKYKRILAVFRKKDYGKSLIVMSDTFLDSASPTEMMEVNIKFQKLLKKKYSGAYD